MSRTSSPFPLGVAPKPARENPYTVTQGIALRIRRAAENQQAAKVKFIEACEWMARNLHDAANNAKAGHYVTETVMSSSLVQDIHQHATEYRLHGEQLRMLRELDEIPTASMEVAS